MRRIYHGDSRTYRRRLASCMGLRLNRKKGSCRRRPWISQRDVQGAPNNLVRELEVERRLHNYLRMSSAVMPIVQVANFRFAHSGTFMQSADREWRVYNGGLGPNGFLRAEPLVRGRPGRGKFPFSRKPKAF